jgi:hypothetical protein
LDSSQHEHLLLSSYNYPKFSFRNTAAFSSMRVTSARS